MTQQSHFDQTDVNAIVARFERTGVMPTGTRTPQYGDVTALQEDLTTLINQSMDIQKRASEFIEQWQPTPPATPETPPAASPEATGASPPT